MILVPSNESQEYISIGTWLKDKLLYHIRSSHNKVKRLQVNFGEVWFCDLGYNIGREKNKVRPVLVLSNNKINKSEKVVVVAITDAIGKLNKQNLPAQDSWYLLYSDTQDVTKMFAPGRLIPNNQKAYSFLEKDSVLQCEEIRSVSKVRLDATRGCIGKLSEADMNNIKSKFKRAYNL